MASLYGLQLYGLDLYSSGITVLDTTGAPLAITIGGTAILTRVTSFTAVASFSVSLSGSLAKVNELQGALSFNLVPGGNLLGTMKFSGDDSFTINTAGELIVPQTAKFNGNLGIAPDLKGVLNYHVHFSAAPLRISVDIEGGATVYIGPFWDPDVPLSGFWVPDNPASGFWVPDKSTTGPWIAGNG